MERDHSKMIEEMLAGAEGMRNTILVCKRAGLHRKEWKYYLCRMMDYTESALNRTLGKSRILRDVKEW
jgi:hypothetical protein